jgi:hypothetical protein
MEYIKMHQLDEASLVRLYQHTLDRNIGIVTAFRGRYTKSENLSRNSNLQADIRAAGFGFYRMEGHYIEGFGSELSKDVKEQSFLVIGDKGNDNGKLKGLLKKLGNKYNQDSILYKSFDNKNAMLIGTQAEDEDGNEVEFPGFGKEISVGEFKPMKVSQFYSKMKGKPFVFESYGAQMTWMEAYAQYILSKKRLGA